MVGQALSDLREVAASAAGTPAQRSMYAMYEAEVREAAYTKTVAAAACGFCPPEFCEGADVTCPHLVVACGGGNCLHPEREDEPHPERVISEDGQIVFARPAGPKGCPEHDEVLAVLTVRLGRA